MTLILFSGLFFNTFQSVDAEEYINEDLGFNFEYPGDWNIIREDYDPIAESLFFEEIVEINDGIFPKITISAKPVEDLFTKYLDKTRTSLDYVLEKENSTKKDPNDRLIGISKIDVGGDQADKITYTMGVEYGGTIYDLYRVDSYLTKGEYVFEFSLQAIMLEMTDSDEEVYDEILKSFKFEE